ncbi:phenylacetate--CoA ligase [Oceanidesulfovibrio marinus]|nr:phenylacetate--CoA ligase [Oceanidesulfovibrio marinus]
MDWQKDIECMEREEMTKLQLDSLQATLLRV